MQRYTPVAKGIDTSITAAVDKLVLSFFKKTQTSVNAQSIENKRLRIIRRN